MRFLVVQKINNLTQILPENMQIIYSYMNVTNFINQTKATRKTIKATMIIIIKIKKINI